MAASAKGRQAGRMTAAQKKAAGAEVDKPALHIDGKTYELGDLTLGELEELEEHVGLPMDMLSWGSAKVIGFVVYLVRRRDDPNYTLADAQGIRISAVKSKAEGGVAVVGDEDGESPTAAAAE